MIDFRIFPETRWEKVKGWIILILTSPWWALRFIVWDGPKFLSKWASYRLMFSKNEGALHHALFDTMYDEKYLKRSEVYLKEMENELTGLYDKAVQEAERE